MSLPFVPTKSVLIRVHLWFTNKQHKSASISAGALGVSTSHKVVFVYAYASLLRRASLTFSSSSL